MWFYTGIYDKLNNGDIKLYIFYKYYYLIKIIIGSGGLRKFSS